MCSFCELLYYQVGHPPQNYRFQLVSKLDDFKEDTNDFGFDPTSKGASQRLTFGELPKPSFVSHRVQWTWVKIAGVGCRMLGSSYYYDEEQEEKDHEPEVEEGQQQQEKEEYGEEVEEEEEQEEKKKKEEEQKENEEGRVGGVGGRGGGRKI